jgi:hypothetical protein
MKIWTATLFMFLLNILQTSNAAVGIITEQLDNPATIQRSKTMLAGTKGTGVEMEDAVQTTRGKVGIVFADDTKVQVNENSKLVIDDFVYDPKSKDASKLAINMVSGTVRYASGSIAKSNPNNVSINTPTATVAVRGTDFTGTIDELGGSTFILLPSCPRKDMLPDEIERLCKTGKIEISNDAGIVILDQAFQATKVTNRGVPPTKPITLKLNEDSISNILILAPPQEIKQRQYEQANKITQTTGLSQNFLQLSDFNNVLNDQQSTLAYNILERNFLDNNFLMNILILSNEELSKEFGNLLATRKTQLLPDYKKESGVIANLDGFTVELSRQDASNNTASITTPKSQNSTITINQGNVPITNRINTGGNNIIIVRQH